MTLKSRPTRRKINRAVGRDTRSQMKSADPKVQGFTDTLGQSMHDAELLMSYAGRFGVTIENKVLNGITHARELLQRGLLHGENEAEFYQNFIALSKAVYPVTVRSLKSCIVEQDFSKCIFWRRKQTAANRILKTHRFWGFVALIILMVVQTYWVIGSFLTTNLPILSDDTSQFSVALKERAVWSTVNWDKAPMGKSDKQNSRGTKELQDVRSGSEMQLTTEDDHDTSENQKVIDPRVSFEVQRMLRSRDDTYAWLLDIWASPGVKIAETSNWAFQAVHGSDQAVGPSWKSGTVGKEVLNVLQTYVLPPLYGWVGAMAYVLRRLISEINSRTYQKDSDTSYNLRIYLGVLAGLAIGWFLAPSTKAGGNVLQVLSPLALAFLAGYSVELLFSAMDRLLEAFSAKSPISKSS